MFSDFTRTELLALKPGDSVVVHHKRTMPVPQVYHVDRVNAATLVLGGGMVVCCVTADVVAGTEGALPPGYRPRMYRAEPKILAQLIAHRQIQLMRAIINDLGNEGLGSYDTGTIERLYHAATAATSPEPFTQG